MTDTVSREIVELAALADDWRLKLIVTDKNAPRPLLANVMTALRCAPEWQGVLAFNDFAFRSQAASPPPWAGNAWSPGVWEDADDVRCADWMQHHGIAVSPDTVCRAVETVAHDHAFHPVRDYLEGIAWDGTPRHLASAYLDADDNDYTRAVGRNFLISAVARICRPGVKVDHLMILEGPQGTLKSSALRKLAEPWFTDEIAEIGSKDAAMQTRGVWIIEISELESMTRAEIAKVKAFLSRDVDRYRPSYGRRVIESPRQCVFAGTTNSDSYLKDETGGRRFWPIKCGRIDLDALARDRDQLWAEARELYRAGQPWWFDTDALIDAATTEQDARYQGDPWTDAVLDFLDKEAKTETSVSELLSDAIFLAKDRWSKADQMRVGGILTKAGWHRFQKRIGDKRRWKYCKEI